MTRKPLSYHLAPVAVLLVALAAAGNWYLRPERATAWAIGMFTLPVLWGAAALVLHRTRRRATDPAASEYAVRSIRQGVAFAGVLLLISLSLKLAAALSTVGEPELTRRTTNVIAGLVLAYFGNLFPKTLTPLFVLQCDGSRMQRFQRLTGWTWVLTGLAYATSWIVLPIATADTVSMSIVVAGMLIGVTLFVRLVRTGRRTSPPASVQS